MEEVEETKPGKTTGELIERFLYCIHEVGEALVFACNITSHRMNDSAYRVETTSRLAQWRIENLASCTYRKSDPFKIGSWNWHLAIEKNRVLLIKLYPEISSFTRQNPPVASFIIRVLCPIGGRKALVHPEITDKQLKGNDDFVWAIEVPLTGKFIIDIEFLDLKIFSKDGTELNSIWSAATGAITQTQNRSNTTALTSLSKMLTESIHTDITITSQTSTFHAHRAILASRSPVFRSMFSHNLKEKENSTVDVSADIPAESCQALLNYMYGNLENEEFLAHRLELLCAAEKYDIVDLKQACHESLLEDIDTKNVLERLQNAWLYGLDELKGSCLRYLVKFGKIYDVKDEFNVFLQCADRELIALVFEEILATWKGF